MTITNFDLTHFINIPGSDMASIGVGAGALGSVTSGTKNTVLAPIADGITSGSNILIVGTANASGFSTSSNTFWMGAGSTAIMSATATNTTPVVTIPGNLVVSGTFTASGAVTDNGLTITASTGTLTIANGKTFTVNNTLTLAGTDSTTMTFPATSQTIAGLGTVQTWSAAQTFTNSDIKLLGSSTGATTFTSANAGASNYTLTVPAVTDTLVTLTGVGAAVGGVASGSYSQATSTGGTTLSTVTGMACALAVGTYVIDGYLQTQCAATPGLKLSLSSSSIGVTSLLIDTFVYSASTLTAETQIAALSSNLVAAAVTASVVEFTGTIIVSTAGTLTLQAAQDVTGNATALTIANGSYLTATRIA